MATPIRGTDMITTDAAIKAVLSASPTRVRGGDVSLYTATMVGLCRQFGLRSTVLVAQAWHETGGFSSAHWATALNPAGLGITGPSDTTPYKIENGADAAEMHVWSMLVALREWDDAARIILPDGAEGWVTRWTAKYADPACPAVNDVEDLNRIYSGNRATWATDPQYDTKLLRVLQQLFPQENQPMSITFGRVPRPEMTIRHATKTGPGNGYTYVPGGRAIVGACDHITDGLGSLDFYYSFFSIGGERHADALVDYVIARDGSCIELNDPWGTRSPWANGSANGVEGDGTAYIAKFGLAAVNDRLASIEHVGVSPNPMTAAQLEKSAQLKAWLFDRAGVSYTSFPVNQNFGVVTHLQHWEFSTKPCPGAGIIGQTAELQARIKAIMQQFQESAAPEPAPEPEPEQPKHEIPKGKTVELLRRQYGHAVNPVTGEDEGFDLTKQPSQMWLAYGKRTGRWPELRRIIRRGDGAQLYQWSDGFEWERPAGRRIFADEI